MSIFEAAATGARGAVYGLGQAARIGWYTGHYAVGRRRMGPLTDPGEAPPAPRSAPLDRTRLRTAFRDLFRADWRHIAAGDYRMPLELARPPSPLALIRRSRDYLRDADAVARRKARRGHSEVRQAAGDEGAAGAYPRYYLQNFHFQSDGWLSEASAARYDMQVETLFTGAAAAMRRQALPFVGAAIAGRPAPALVDLGCGAGGLLPELARNFPRLEVTGVDLSPAYLARARRATGRGARAHFVAANAEETGLPEGAFDVATAVYLFHEMPPRARVRVAAEIARLLRPGGTFVLVDTLQYGDEPGLDILLETFPRGFHEPYYDGYCRADLDDLFGRAGLEKTDETLAFLSKVSVFRKPEAA